MNGSDLLIIVWFLTNVFPILKLAGLVWLIGGTLQLVLLVKRHPRYWTVIVLIFSWLAFTKVWNNLLPGSRIDVISIWVVMLVGVGVVIQLLTALYQRFRLRRFAKEELRFTEPQEIPAPDWRSFYPAYPAATASVSSTAVTEPLVSIPPLPEDYSDLDEFDADPEEYATEPAIKA
jgi:hypothetical protein